MRTAILLSSLLGLSALLGGSGPGAASEIDFTYVTGMPDIEGELRETRSSRDGRTGVVIRKSVYVYEHEGFDLHTHVVAAGCDEVGDDVEPTIVALQYFPKNPQSFTVASMPDLFLEVFARDEDERIRAYQELSGRQMMALTDRFLPVCRTL